jgi:hypothetical protein
MDTIAPTLGYSFYNEAHNFMYIAFTPDGFGSSKKNSNTHKNLISTLVEVGLVGVVEKVMDR